MSTTYTKIDLATVEVPVGVIIGRKGCTINEMKKRSGARICIKGDQICISGSQKSILSAKELIREIVRNFQNGVNGFQQIQRREKSRRKVVVATDGWNHVTRSQTDFPELNQKKEVKVAEVSCVWNQIVKKETIGRSIAEINVDLEQAEAELKLLRETVGSRWADIADNEAIIDEAIEKVDRFECEKTAVGLVE